MADPRRRQVPTVAPGSVLPGVAREALGLLADIDLPDGLRTLVAIPFGDGRAAIDDARTVSQHTRGGADLVLLGTRGPVIVAIHIADPCDAVGFGERLARAIDAGPTVAEPGDSAAMPRRVLWVGQMVIRRGQAALRDYPGPGAPSVQAEQDDQWDGSGIAGSWVLPWAWRRTRSR